MVLFEKGQPVVTIPAFGAEEVADVTGAGDTVIATLTLALISGAPLSDAARLAMSICDPAEDQRGDVEYKTAMSGEMTQRALRTAHERVK